MMHDPWLEAQTDILQHKEEFKYRGRAYNDGSFFVQDFTLAEVKSLNMRDPYGDRYKIATMQEAIDLIRILNKEFPRTSNKRKIGFYIEIKDWQWTQDYSGQNVADLLSQQLYRNGLGDLECPAEGESAYADIPVVIQSYELEALRYYKKLSDLPLVLVVGLDWEKSIRTKAVEFLEGLKTRRPYKTWASKAPNWA